MCVCTRVSLTLTCVCSRIYAIWACVYHEKWEYGVEEGLLHGMRMPLHTYRTETWRTQLVLTITQEYAISCWSTTQNGFRGVWRQKCRDVCMRNQTVSISCMDKMSCIFYSQYDSIRGCSYYMWIHMNLLRRILSALITIHCEITLIKLLNII